MASAGEDAVGSGPRPRGARLYFALLLAAGLASALGIALVSQSGGDETPVDPPDVACIESWNEDPAAVAVGRHQSGGHGYIDVQILRVDAEGEAVEDGDSGSCAVVFAAQALDPEPAAAAVVLGHGRWRALSSRAGVDSETLGRLQSEAVAGANAFLTPAGTITTEPEELGAPGG